MTARPVLFQAPIEHLSAVEASLEISDLACVLVACVEGGAGVGFVLPFSRDAAETFWRSRLAGLESGERHLLIVRHNGRIAGTVMLNLADQANGGHRAEIAKLLVHPDARRRGYASLLMKQAEVLSLALGRWLLVLDTVTGDTAEEIYPRLGYTRVGVIPEFAVSAFGAFDTTTVFYKQLK